MKGGRTSKAKKQVSIFLDQVNNEQKFPVGLT